MKRTIKKSATADSINLMEAFAEFIEEKEAQNKSAATIHNYKQSFEKYCAFNEFDDNTGIEEADQKAFLHWVNTMAQDLTPTTVNHYLRDVRTFLNWCMDEDRAYIEKRFKMKELSVQDTKPKAFSDDDIALLMEKPNRKADFAEWRTYVIVCWIMDNGARAQTVCCVKMEDIDLKKKTITYAHTKNKKAQVVGMSDTLKTILKEYIRKWRYGATEEDYLFPNIGDEQLMYNFIKQRNNKEDAQWFVDLMREHRKDVPLNSGKAKSEKGKSYDFAYIREEFAKKFFKEISDEYKKAQKKTFDDELTELLNSFDAA